MQGIVNINIEVSLVNVCWYMYTYSYVYANFLENDQSVCDSLSLCVNESQNSSMVKALDQKDSDSSPPLAQKTIE